MFLRSYKLEKALDLIECPVLMDQAKLVVQTKVYLCGSNQFFEKFHF